MQIKLGSAPDSWGVWFPDDPKQIPWSRFLDEIAEAGYEWTELGPYGYLPTDVGVLRRELERRNLNVCGTFALAAIEDPQVWPELERQVRGAAASLSELGARFLILIDDVYSNLFTGEKIHPATLDEDAWQRLIDTTHRIADIVTTEYGLTLVFHPHAETHVEYEHQIERLLSETDPDTVSLCLDTGHHAYRGGDPVAFMRKHHARIPYLHLKSVDAGVRQRTERDSLPFAHAVKEGVFREPAEGIVDFLAFRDVLQSVSYEGWAVVEQDMYPVPSFDVPLPIAKRTRAYLRDLGLG